LLLRIDADPLPTLTDPTRGTPTGSVPVLRELPHRSRWGWKHGAAVALLAIVASSWTFVSRRARPAPAVTPPPAESLHVDGVPATAAATTTAPDAGDRRGKQGAAVIPAASDSARSAAALPAAQPAPEAAPGLMRARAYPVDAEILVDGQSLGRGIVLDVPLPPGRRRVRVSAPGYADFDTTIAVVSGRTVQLPRITLRPMEVAP
jgi:PEGA domain